MSDFQKTFEKAVLEVAAEINAMDDSTFAQMLAQHRDGDVAQIMRESGVDLMFDELEIPLFAGRFSSDVVDTIILQSQFQATSFITPRRTTNPAPPKECLIAA